MRILEEQEERKENEIMYNKRKRLLDLMCKKMVMQEVPIPTQINYLRIAYMLEEIDYSNLFI